MTDLNLARAAEQISAARSGGDARLAVGSFFDEPTNTASYVIHDLATRRGARP